MYSLLKTEHCYFCKEKDFDHDILGLIFSDIQNSSRWICRDCIQHKPIEICSHCGAFYERKEMSIQRETRTYICSHCVKNHHVDEEGLIHLI